MIRNLNTICVLQDLQYATLCKAALNNLIDVSVGLWYQLDAHRPSLRTSSCRFPCDAPYARLLNRDATGSTSWKESRCGPSQCRCRSLTQDNLHTLRLHILLVRRIKRKCLMDRELMLPLQTWRLVGVYKEEGIRINSA